MSARHALIHPVEEVPAIEGEGGNTPRVRIKDIQGMPGTPGGLSLCVSQFIFAAAALSIMGSASDFPSITAFCYPVVAVSLQSLWCFSLAIVDVYALLVWRSLQNYWVVTLLKNTLNNLCCILLLT